ncbi:hypothetical protein [Neisseria wadsworthii]|uniref:Uncharacterized protein n=1 Tax=Neisseria wadsworthii 9715 TaxID=1030841 RepID=G4CN67_9NEIS|nr:hypothetical protein [Neisseria wadsworthii]EGZ50280.1 hypothetical protein HMPREF9370_0526 [Neisseria wadsworthii 9715]QMT36518.1 hypothetical protein H3L96_04695 [Neisseria wadsworthii]
MDVRDLCGEGEGKYFMKKIETVLFRPSVVNGLVLAGLNSIKPFSYVERTGLTCLITAATIFILRKKIIHTYNENIIPQPL